MVLDNVIMYYAATVYCFHDFFLVREKMFRRFSVKIPNSTFTKIEQERTENQFEVIQRPVKDFVVF